MSMQDKPHGDNTIKVVMVAFFFFMAVCAVVGGLLQANEDIDTRKRLERAVDSLNAIVAAQQNDIDSLTNVRGKIDTLITEKDRVIKSIVVRREATVQKIGTLELPDLVNTFKIQLDSARQ